LPILQRNAFAKSGDAVSVPLTRHFAGECGSTLTSIDSYSGRIFAHHVWPKLRKNCWSSVKPSATSVSGADERSAR
jgi:hypothetical protein